MARLAWGESSSAANPVLDVYIRTIAGALVDPVALEFAIFDYTTGSEVQVSPPTGYTAINLADVPAGQRLSLGRFFAPHTVISGANVGTYRVRWRATDPAGTIITFTDEFEVVEVPVAGAIVSGVQAESLAALGLDIHTRYTATRIRRTGGRTLGVFGETARSTTTFACSVQPARGRDLENLPEAKRSKGALKFITRTDLRTADEAQMADLISWDGADHEVEHAEPWPPHSTQAVFTKALAVRVEA